MMKSAPFALCLLTSGVMAASTTLKISTKLKGKAPKPTLVRMNADPECARQNKDKVYDESFVVDTNGNLDNSFVYIKQGMAPVPAPKDMAPVVLDQRACIYRPHVSGIRVGQSLEIVNSDPTLHNVHSTSANNPSFNVGMANRGKLPARRFDKPEVMVRLKCDVHGWMHAYLGVVDHPYFAVTKSGKATIKDVPPGKYTVEAWHERLGTQTAEVTVDEKGGVKDVAFTFERKE